MEDMVMFKGVYDGKRVLVTGATGFKGSWLCSWLLDLGAEVYGYSLDLVSSVNLFGEADLKERMAHEFGDVRDFPKLEQYVSDVQPDFIFHLAAQAIVSVSYENPLNTISTNVIGTANILEAALKLQKHVTTVIITSDKCYENVEQLWGYKEDDPVGGKDIYSASKGAAEIIFSSYYRSFYEGNDFHRVASVRAGNVIGGGDWAKDRIVVDAVKMWNDGGEVQLRSPFATRPWQHVLEPLSGYLWLGALLSSNNKNHFNGESYNFGPNGDQVKTVFELTECLSKYWKNGPAAVECGKTKQSFYEAGLLKLNIEKANIHLNWEPTLGFDECCKFVSEWYSDFYAQRSSASALVHDDIKNYCQLAKMRGKQWTA